LTNGKTYLAVLVHVNYFDSDDIVNLEMFMNVLDIAIGNFGDMNESRNAPR